MPELTPKQMADGLKVPSSRVSEWTKRGMPTDSIQAAAAWRMIHARPRTKGTALAPQLRQDKPAAAGTHDHSAALDTGWEARLERTRQVELQIFETITASLAKGDVTVLQRLQAAHVAAVKEIAAAEKIALEIRTASKELLHIDRVKRIMCAVADPIRQALDLLPITERSRCNPDHPEIAYRALKEWVDRLLRQVSKMESPEFQD